MQGVRPRAADFFSNVQAAYQGWLAGWLLADRLARCQAWCYKLLLAAPAPACRPCCCPCWPCCCPSWPCSSTGSLRASWMVALTAAWSEGNRDLSCAAGSRPCTSADSTLRGGGWNRQGRRAGAVKVVGE